MHKTFLISWWIGDPYVDGQDGRTGNCLRHGKEVRTRFLGRYGVWRKTSGIVGFIIRCNILSNIRGRR